MNTDNGPDSVDTRIVLRVYAGLTVLAGLLLLVSAPPWLTTTLVSEPGARLDFMRLCGALLLAAGCVATGFAQVEDPRNRHLALGWFATAHLVVAIALLILVVSQGGPDGGDVSLPILAGTTLLLFYFWQTGDGHRAGDSMGLIQLFGLRQPSAEQLRSAYEERIRAAASQEERHRLARDLHDSIKQQIFAMQTAAATAQTRFDSDPPGAKEALDRLRESGREAMTEMEAMLDSLRSAPLENVGLVEALKKQSEALQFRTGAHVNFEIGPLPQSERLAPAAQQAIFRVAQEALANIGRHARATRVRVSLASETGRVVLRIEDNGAGFVPGGPVEAAGMGLTNMRARAEMFAGALDVQSLPGAGTVVTLSIPHTAPTRPDVSDYRRRAIVWAALVAFQTLCVVGQQLAFKQERPFLLMNLALVAASAVVLARAIVTWNRARRRAESASWIESPSHL